MNQQANIGLLHIIGADELVKPTRGYSFPNQSKGIWNLENKEIAKKNDQWLIQLCKYLALKIAPIDPDSKEF